MRRPVSAVSVPRPRFFYFSIYVTAMAAVHLESGASGGEERISVPVRARRAAAGRPRRGTPLTAARLEARTSGLGTRHGREVRGHVPRLRAGRPSVRPGGEARARASVTNCALTASGPGGGKVASRTRCGPSGRGPGRRGRPSGRPRSSCQGRRVRDPRRPHEGRSRRAARTRPPAGLLPLLMRRRAAG